MIYKKVFILLALHLVIFKIYGQNQEDLKQNFLIGLNAGFNFSPNGNTYGMALDISKSFYSNKSKTIKFYSGIQEDFRVKSEKDFEGTSGTSVSNHLHIILGTGFYFLKSRKLFLNIGAFAGWSFKLTNGKVNNPRLEINRSYTYKRHYFSRGLLIQTGYLVKQDMELSLFIKADLRRLTDGDGILEYPELLYGIGIRKSF
jgi:hypothetical protein